MTHNQKMDYLLTIFNQHPEMIYNDLYKIVDIRMSWDEYIKLIKELINNKCLEYDFYVGVRITEWGRYKLIHSFYKEEKAQRELSLLEDKEIESNKVTGVWHEPHYNQSNMASIKSLLGIFKQIAIQISEKYI